MMVGHLLSASHVISPSPRLFFVVVGAPLWNLKACELWSYYLGSKRHRGIPGTANDSSSLSAIAFSQGCDPGFVSTNVLFSKGLDNGQVCKVCRMVLWRKMESMIAGCFFELLLFPVLGALATIPGILVHAADKHENRSPSSCWPWRLCVPVGWVPLGSKKS